MKHPRPNVLVSCAALLAALLAVAGFCWWRACRNMAIGATASGLQSLACLTVQVGLFHESRPFAFPEGAASELYSWLINHEYVTAYAWRLGAPMLADEKNRTFRDPWGNELVYRFPPRSPTPFFELYSLGPNGQDEGGAGDDITCNEAAKMETWRGAFTHGGLDIEYIWRNRKNLRRDPRDGTIIGRADSENQDASLLGGHGDFR